MPTTKRIRDWIIADLRSVNWSQQFAQFFFWIGIGIVFGIGILESL